jgi:hypothetical protein
LFQVAKESNSSKLYTGLVLNICLLSKDLIFLAMERGLEPNVPVQQPRVYRVGSYKAPCCVAP